MFKKLAHIALLTLLFLLSVAYLPQTTSHTLPTYSSVFRGHSFSNFYPFSVSLTFVETSFDDFPPLPIPSPFPFLATGSYPIDNHTMDDSQAAFASHYPYGFDLDMMKVRSVRSRFLPVPDLIFPSPFFRGPWIPSVAQTPKKPAGLLLHSTARPNPMVSPLLPILAPPTLITTHSPTTDTAHRPPSRNPSSPALLPASRPTPCILHRPSASTRPLTARACK